MTIRFAVPGSEHAAPEEQPVGTEAFEDAAFRIEVKGAVAVEPTRAAAVSEIEAAEDDVVELTFDDGTVFCLPAGALRDDLAVPTRGEATVVPIPGRMSVGAPSRGLGDWLLRGFRVLTVNLGADLAAHALVEHVEGKLNKLGPGPGLYECPNPSKLGGPVTGSLPGDGPVLVFIHGTASSTAGSFSALAEGQHEALWREILSLHGGRVFALEHRTLSVSPVQNALDLAEKLPANCRLRMVSHSRGGLVGELLCRGRFDALDLDQFGGDDWAAERQRLQQLDKLLRAKNVQVERFVRVACPARGTTLASKRLDRYLSLVLNAIGLVPALAASPLYGYVKSLLIAIAKKRMDPEDLPGLEAQMPESRLVKVLNRSEPDFQVAADLTVIAGDIEGSGVWQRLAVLATDLFYRDDHDLVVNTWAMTGGGRRDQDHTALYAFDAGPEVSHFNYFRNARTAGKLLSALRSPDERKREFVPLPEKQQRLEVRAAPTAPSGPRPVLFVLPGIMGTCLSSGGKRIWVSPEQIALGRLEELGIDSAAALDGMMDEYDALLHFMAVSHDVVPFPFDWRLSVFEEAARLAKEVDARLAATAQPIRFLAHSMGGLVVRALMEQSPKTWDKVATRPDARLVMLGTPNRGSYAIPHILLGRERIFRGLAQLDFHHGPTWLVKLVGNYPGLLDMLPSDELAPVFSADWWTPLVAAVAADWPPPDTVRLTAAADRRRRLDTACPDPRFTVYVAGSAPETPWGVQVVKGDDGESQLELHGTTRGDGRVTWASGIPDGVPTWYMEASHGDLAHWPPAFLALQELLQKGTTERLSQHPPQPRGGDRPDFVLADRGIDLYPDRDELAAAAVGFAAAPPIAPPSTDVLRVSVAMGSLVYARYPVMVGHYKNDGIYSAEKVLDGRLDGKLTRRHALGIYPDALGEYTLLLDPQSRPTGGLVVGLGEVGELSPGTLTRAIESAALSYSMTLADGSDGPCGTALAAAAAGSGGAGAVGLSAVLIGSSESGVGLRASIASILKGVWQANQKVAESKTRVGRVAEVELVELAEDIAISAARILADLKEDGAVAPGLRLEVSPEIRRIGGERQRLDCGADQTWWHRLQISQPDPLSSDFEFLDLTDRARVEERRQSMQARMADRLIAGAVHNPSWDPRTSHTLFSLLVPNALKRFAPDQRNLVLVLDEHTARVPWELLADEPNDTREPIAVRAGLVRQLRKLKFDENPVAAGGEEALIVGEPKSGLASLPGARAEAADVARLVNGYYKPVHLDQPTLEQVLGALFERPYRLLHLAGHGMIQPDGYSGMVLEDDMLLGPREIANIGPLPDLVVVNCCHLGAIGTPELHVGRPHEFAAGFAAKLIAMGVRAVVAAGWAVDDGAARTFSLRLYERLLQGRTFGDAVRDAREAAYRAFPRSNTWGAYQCYGDPGFRLRVGGRPPKSSSRSLVDPREAIIALENWVSDAGVPPDAAELRAYLKDLPEPWQKRADVCGAAARALLAAGCVDAAVDRCLHALKSDRGRLYLDVVETLVAAIAAGAKEPPVDLGELLTQGTVLEEMAPAPARMLRLAKARIALAVRRPAGALNGELARIEALLERAIDPTGSVELEALVTLAEVRALQAARGARPARAPAEPAYALLERAHALLAACRDADPERGRVFELRMEMVASVLNGTGIRLQADGPPLSAAEQTALAATLGLWRRGGVVVAEPKQAKRGQAIRQARRPRRRRARARVNGKRPATKKPRKPRKPT